MGSQPGHSRIEVEDAGDITVVNFVDPLILGEQKIQKIGDEIFGLVDELGRKSILLNFQNVTYLSSACFDKLITLKKKVKKKGGQLVLCEITDMKTVSIYDVFKITRLNTLFSDGCFPHHPEGPTKGQSEALKRFQ